MAKKPESSEPSATPSKPQITFTEQDVQQMKAFGSFLLSNAKFNLTINDALQLGRYVHFMNQLSQKMEAHILEVRSITKPEGT
jgi:hypothetical protein